MTESKSTIPAILEYRNDPISFLLIVLAIVSRLADLGARTMSHDEINHVVPAYDYFQGRTYNYDPVTHGPFQFHMMALSYFLFGDSDFTSRLPHALFGIFSIAFTLIFFRRYLGRAGAIAAGIFLLASPYMLFYGRYARNEIFIVVWGLLTIYTILRYLEEGDFSILYLFTAVNALHFTDKATSYIFAALELFFLGAYLFYRVTRTRWVDESQFRKFMIGLMAAVLTFGAAAWLLHHTKTTRPAHAGDSWNPGRPRRWPAWPYLRSGLSKDLACLPCERNDPSTCSSCLGHWSCPSALPFPVKLIGGNPLAYDNPVHYPRCHHHRRFCHPGRSHRLVVETRKMVHPCRDFLHSLPAALQLVFQQWSRCRGRVHGCAWVLDGTAGCPARQPAGLFLRAGTNSHL